MKKKEMVSIGYGNLNGCECDSVWKQPGGRNEGGERSEDAEYAEFKTYIYELKTRTG